MAAVRRIDAKFRMYQSVIMRSFASGAAIMSRVASATWLRRHTPAAAISAVIARISAKPAPRRFPIEIFAIKPMWHPVFTEGRGRGGLWLARPGHEILQV
jgi:hypothetical protein